MDKEMKLLYTGKVLQFRFWLEWLDNHWDEYSPVHLRRFYARSLR